MPTSGVCASYTHLDESVGHFLRILSSDDLDSCNANVGAHGCVSTDDSFENSAYVAPPAKTVCQFVLGSKEVQEVLLEVPTVSFDRITAGFRQSPI